MLKWDIPLVDGYGHEFLPGVWRDGPVSALRPLSWGLGRKLRRSRFDVLWVHGYARLTNWAAMLCAKAHGLKVFVRDEATLFSAERSLDRGAAKYLLFRALSKVGDGFLAIGTANRNYYLAQGLRPERIFNMPYCVDNDFFYGRALAAESARGELRKALALEPTRPVILFASKFEPRKRPHDLLGAYERLVALSTAATRPYLLFAGDGELRASLETEAREKGLSDVKFLGFRNQTELPALYGLCDVFVLPSVNEPWGLVVNEVMATGKAVIVSDQVGCAQDLVKNGVNGFIFSARDVAALTEALRASIADHDRAALMGLASREIIERWSFKDAVAGLRLALRTTIG
jgi:glycosyltransferase involved in cell wall biosynthesis